MQNRSQGINPLEERRLPSLPQWYRVYYLLAAFDVLVVVLGLFLTHQILRIYDHSVLVNQQWVEQRNRIGDLGTLASAVNAPGNDVFDSHNVEGESYRMRVALRVFNERTAVFEKELLAQIEMGKGSDAAIQPILDKLPSDVAAIKIDMAEMNKEAELTFSYFQQHQPEMAARQMATMDRRFTRVSASLSQLRDHIGGIQEQLFSKEKQSAISLNRFEYLLGSFVLLMVCGAVVYGHKIKKQSESGAREKEGVLRELQTEIIERKEIELALRESEVKHRDLFENANDMIYTHDLAGNYTSVNKVCEEVTGYTTAELLEMSVSQIIAPEFLAFAREMMPGRGAEKSPSAYEIEIISKGGGRVTLEISSRLMFHNETPFAVQGIARDLTERRRAENEALAISEVIESVSQTSNLNALFEKVHQSLSRVVDARNCFVALYDTKTEFFGMEFFVDQYDQKPSPQKLPKSRTAYIFRTGKPRVMTREVFQRLVKEGEVENVGSPPASWLGVPLADPSGVIGVLVVQHYTNAEAYSNKDLEFLTSVGRQIALALERKRGEEALQESNSILNAVIEGTSDAIFVKDLQGRYLMINPAGAAFCEKPMEEILNKTDLELFPHQTALQFIEADRRVIVAGETQVSEGRATAGDRISDFLVTKSVFRDERGNPAGLIGISHDITDRKRAEEALHESERKLAILIQKTPLAAIEMNPRGEIVEWNPAAEKVFGYRRDEVIGRSVFDAIVPESAQVDVERIWDELISNKGGWRSTNENVTKDGRIIVCDWHNTSLESEGKVIGVGSLVQDITERVRLEQELERARSAALESARLKSEFLANMSHEIRTPMNGVVGMSGLLLDTELTEDQRDFAETIRASGDSLLTIINDILDFSKIEAGKLQFEILDFDLFDAVEGAVELLAEAARSKKIELASLINSDVTKELRGDPGRLRQVLTNLLGNAVKFTEQGEVILRAEKESETEADIVLRFSVTDTGIGISEDAQQNLFQAFIQADGSTTRKYGGTGLGLAISKQLVELMDGEIGVTSEPGKGATFWFTVRLAKQLEQSAAPQRTVQSLNQLRVLIVDDNGTNRKILSHQLSSWGMIHEESDSGARALAMLHSAQARGKAYDLVILDYMMPLMDGLELTRSIKSDPLIAATRLIMLTSRGLRGDSIAAAEAGINACLTKPVRQSQLFACLTNVVNQAAGVPGSEPIAQGPPELMTRHSQNEKTMRPRKLILLAEDNIVNQKVAVRQLEKLGYRADAVANGREAVEALERIPYDAVLMDCQMPEMDGYEATAKIRRLEGRTKHTIIVAMTANALQGDREKCIEAGMDDYISKPVRLDELAKVLERVLGGSLDDQGNQDARAAVTELPEEVVPPVDMARLHEVMGDELFEILDIYLEQTSDNLENLTAAIAAGDAGEVDSIAHNCAGTSANCGMVAVVRPLLELERMGREGSLSGAEALGRQVVSEFQRVKVFLQDNLAPVAV